MPFAHEQAVVVGASAGALEVLSDILPELPADYPLPVIVVVHIPADKESMMVPLLQEKSDIKIEEAVDKVPLAPGKVIFAPPNYHVMLEKGKTIALSTERPVHFSRPSIDVLFETAAEAYRNNLVAVLLTGANSDGAAGIKCVVEKGGIALVQDPKEAEAPVMPQAAINTGADVHVLGVKGIVSKLLELGNLQA